MPRSRFSSSDIAEMRRLRTEDKLSYPAIAKIYNADHTTVMHLIGATAKQPRNLFLKDGTFENPNSPLVKFRAGYETKSKNKPIKSFKAPPEIPYAERVKKATSFKIIRGKNGEVVGKVETPPRVLKKQFYF